MIISVKHVNTDLKQISPTYIKHSRTSRRIHHKLKAFPTQNNIKKFQIRPKTPFPISKSIVGIRGERPSTAITKRKLKQNISVNCECPFPIKKEIIEKQMTLSIQKENRTIKEKMNEYEAFSKSKNVDTSKNIISYKLLEHKFKNLASKISSLIGREVLIKEISEFTNCEVTMKTGDYKYFRLYSKIKPIPLRIHIEVEKGVNQGRLLLSQGILRPTIKNCDKCIPLHSKEIITTYTSSRGEEKLFTRENIYITIEADKDLSIIFQCAFGRGILSIIIRKF